MRNIGKIVNPLSTASPAPTYAALDAGKPGQPTLTPAEAAEVRGILNEIRPCQRPLLRYAFPGPEQEVRFAVFFRLDNDAGQSYVFGTRRLFYRWRGDVGRLPGSPPPNPDAAAIKKQPCNGETPRPLR